MAREKKITVKPLLNQEVKGRQESPLEAARYPLYIEISYNRKYTKFPLGDNWFPISDAEEIKKNPSILKALEAIKKIIRYEVEKDPSFTVTGVTKKIKSYLSPFQLCMLMLLLQHIGIELRKEVPASKLDSWEKLDPGKKIFEGLVMLGDDVHFLINDLLSIFQLLNLMRYDESILSWLIYTDKNQKLKLISKALKQAKKEPVLYKEFGGIGKASEKMSVEDLVSATDYMATLVTDNEVSVSIAHLTIDEIF
jgi:hypothetical protein